MFNSLSVTTEGTRSGRSGFFSKYRSPIFLVSARFVCQPIPSEDVSIVLGLNTESGISIVYLT